MMRLSPLPRLRRGDSYAHTFTGTGSVGYFCLPTRHARRRAAVIVQ